MLIKKPKILFTRSLSDNEQNIAKSNGLEVRIVPFIKTSSNYDKELILKEILSLSDGIDAFVFTSQNAVKALKPLFYEPLFYNILKDKMVFATGAKTLQLPADQLTGSMGYHDRRSERSGCGPRYRGAAEPPGYAGATDRRL